MFKTICSNLFDIFRLSYMRIVMLWIVNCVYISLWCRKQKCIDYFGSISLWVAYTTIVMSTVTKYEGFIKTSQRCSFTRLLPGLITNRCDWFDVYLYGALNHPYTVSAKHVAKGVLQISRVFWIIFMGILRMRYHFWHLHDLVFTKTANHIDLYCEVILSDPG